VHPQDDSALCFRTRERRVKMVNFDVGKNRPKLIGYHSPLDYCKTYVSCIIRIYTSINAETLVKTGSVAVEMFGDIG